MLRTTLLALILCLALPGAAHAAFEIGQDPDGVWGDESFACPQGCTVVQTRLAAIDQVAPEDGVAVSLKLRGANGTARLRVLTGDRAGAASAPVTLSGAIQTVPVSLPLRQGDRLAIELSPGARLGVWESLFDSDLVDVWQPALAEGTTRAPMIADAQAYFAYQAYAEADADGDGRGDESQDDCVFCQPAGGGTPEVPAPPAPYPPATTPAPVRSAPPAPKAGKPADPYAAIRAAGPKVTFAPTVTRKGKTVTISVANPHAFAVSGKLTVKRGRKTVATKKVKLAANQTRKVKVALRGLAGKTKKLALAAALRGPVGKTATTRASVRIGKATKPKTGGGTTGAGTGTPPQDAPTTPADGGIDGTYRGGSGGDAGWVMVIEGGVVKSFNGTMGLTCAKSKAAENHAFTMVGDDPDPVVAPDGSFAWEATGGYGLTKLKFTGRVAGGQVTGNAAVEYRPPVSGVSPVTGLPRMEFDACFGGRDYTLAR